MFSCLVIGTELISQHIVSYLLKQGVEVYVLSSTKSSQNLEQVKYIEGDLWDIELLEKLISKVSYVVHTDEHSQEKNKNNLYRKHVIGTGNIVNLCLKHKIKKLCHISSIMSISNQDSIQDSISVDETNTFSIDGEDTSRYSMLKFWSEQEVWRGVAEGLQAVILNPSTVLNLMPKKGLLDTSLKLSYVDGDDLAKACFLVLNDKVNAERFIVSAGQISYYDLFALVASKTGKKLYKSKIPRFLTRLISHVFGLKAAYGECVSSDKQYTSLKLKEYFDFEFRSLEQSISVLFEASKCKKV